MRFLFLAFVVIAASPAILSSAPDQSSAQKETTSLAAFRPFDDLPTTSALVLFSKVDAKETLEMVSPETVESLMNRAKLLHEEGMALFAEFDHALKNGDPALDFSDNMFRRTNQLQPNRTFNADERGVRLRRQGLTDLRARIDANGEIRQISLILQVGSYDSRRQYFYHVKDHQCQLFGVTAQTPDGLFRHWLFRPDQSLLGTARCDSQGILNGTFLEWNEDGTIVQAATFSSSKFFFESPFVH